MKRKRHNETNKQTKIKLNTNFSFRLLCCLINIKICTLRLQSFMVMLALYIICADAGAYFKIISDRIRIRFVYILFVCYYVVFSMPLPLLRCSISFGLSWWWCCALVVVERNYKSIENSLQISYLLSTRTTM